MTTSYFNAVITDTMNTLGEFCIPSEPYKQYIQLNAAVNAMGVLAQYTSDDFNRVAIHGLSKDIINTIYNDLRDLRSCSLAALGKVQQVSILDDNCQDKIVKIITTLARWKFAYGHYTRLIPLIEQASCRFQEIVRAEEYYAREQTSRIQCAFAAMEYVVQLANQDTGQEQIDRSIKQILTAVYDFWRQVANQDFTQEQIEAHFQQNLSDAHYFCEYLSSSYQQAFGERKGMSIRFYDSGKRIPEIIQTLQICKNVMPNPTIDKAILQLQHIYDEELRYAREQHMRIGGAVTSLGEVLQCSLPDEGKFYAPDAVGAIRYYYNLLSNALQNDSVPVLVSGTRFSRRYRLHINEIIQDLATWKAALPVQPVGEGQADYGTGWSESMKLALA